MSGAGKEGGWVGIEQLRLAVWKGWMEDRTRQLVNDIDHTY
jgi:hypothetical protein